MCVHEHTHAHTHWTISPSCVYNLLKQLKWYKEASLFLGYSSENKSLEHWLVLQMSGPTWLSLPLPSLTTLTELSSWGPTQPWSTGSTDGAIYRPLSHSNQKAEASEVASLQPRAPRVSKQMPQTQHSSAEDIRHADQWEWGESVSAEFMSPMRPVSTEELSTTPCSPYPDSSLILYVGLEATLQDFFWDISQSSIHDSKPTVLFSTSLGTTLGGPSGSQLGHCQYLFSLRQWSVGILSQEATAWGSVLAGMSVLPGIICFPGLECTGLRWTLLLILCLQCQRVATV